MKYVHKLAVYTVNDHCIDRDAKGAICSTADRIAAEATSGDERRVKLVKMGPLIAVALGLLVLPDGFAGGGGGDDGGDRDAGEERERAREQLLGAAGLG